MRDEIASWSAATRTVPEIFALGRHIDGVLVPDYLFLHYWIGWFGDSAGPKLGPLTSWLSITEHIDDFSKGIIDTKHVLYYLTLITFGLFLTAKSVDTERWRG